MRVIHITASCSWLDYCNALNTGHSLFYCLQLVQIHCCYAPEALVASELKTVWQLLKQSIYTQAWLQSICSMSWAWLVAKGGKDYKRKVKDGQPECAWQGTGSRATGVCPGVCVYPGTDTQNHLPSSMLAHSKIFDWSFLLGHEDRTGYVTDNRSKQIGRHWSWHISVVIPSKLLRLHTSSRAH